jgi:glycerol-3-phosphate O-acyltransferase
LNYVVDAADHVGAQVYLVPVSIMYDQLPTNEVELMASEARGQGKSPENVRWFLGYLRGLRRRLGRIYVDIGEPMSLQDRLGELVAEDPSGTHAVERIALEVCHRINVATPVTPTAAVCISLLAANRALTLEEILSTVEPLAEYLRARNRPTAGGANLTDRATVRRAAQDLVRSGVLTSHSAGRTTVWGVGQTQHLVAAVYRNSAIHVLVLRAIAELVLVSTEDAIGDSPDEAWNAALRLRDLLKFEFFFAGREEFLDEIRSEFRLIIGGDWLGDVDTELDRDDAKRCLASLTWVTAHLVLRPFIDSYSVVARQLFDLGVSGTFDEPTFIDQCLLVGHQWALRGCIASEESSSAEMFRNALRLCANRGLLDPETPDLAQRRQDLVDEIREVQRNIERISTVVRQEAGNAP